MAGLYIHIPFCKQACCYCDFHFSTLLSQKSLFLSALKKEIAFQKNFFGDGESNLNSIYFGGGTPSLLSAAELNDLFEGIADHFIIAGDAEITFEANPDDLTRKKIAELKDTPVNRLSIGIQSFRDEDLSWMNRGHTGTMALSSVRYAREHYSNISIDLIYGIPALTEKSWLKNLHQAFELDIQHISAYCLTVEAKTPLENLIRKGKVKNVDEEQAAVQFEMMTAAMKENNFIQYEISNFCKKGFHSRHNSNYWAAEKYLGVGPSAHSFDGKNRQWNIANNSLYIKSINEEKIPFKQDLLTEEKRYNEYILTSLRTISGTSLDFIANNFPPKYLEHCIAENSANIDNNLTLVSGSTICLTEKGKLFADAIASSLFLIED